MPSSSRSLTTVQSACVARSHTMPFGLRSPVAYSRLLPLGRSTSQIAARPSSTVHAVFRDVAVRADRGVELLAIAAREQRLGPVVIASGRQVGDLRPLRRDSRRTCDVGKAQHRIGIGNIEIVADESHTERRIQALDEGHLDSALPSPLASRSSVIRLALGTPAPASFMKNFISFALMPDASRGGAFVSATNTSPLGSTYSQRG